MKTPTRSALLFGTALIFLTTLIAIPAQAEDDAATGVLQLFTCSFAPGKTAENVWQVLEMARETSGPYDESDPAADPGFGLFVWFPYRGSTGYDFVWGLTHTDLDAMMRGQMDWIAEGNQALMGPRFEALGDCNATISMTEQIKAGELGIGEDRQLDAMVETFACTLTDGADMDDVRSATDFWSAQIDRIDSPQLDRYQANLVMPLRGQTGEWDFGWLGTSPDPMTWAEGLTDYLSSREGQAADDRFARISRCNSALWAGYWVMTPANLK